MSQLRTFASIQYDDAYVTYRYAESLLSGHGLRFNVGDASNSASSLLFVLMLAVISIATKSTNLPLIANFLNLVSVFVAVFFITFSILKLARNSIAVFVAAIPVFSLVLFSYAEYWAFSGMETMFFISLGIITCLYTILYQNGHDLLGIKPLLILLFLLSITRVDGFVISFVVSFWFSVWNIVESQKFKFQIRNFTYLIPLSALIMQLCFNKIYYGEFLNDPIHFKPLVNYYASNPQSQINAIKYFFTNLYNVSLLINVVVAAVLIVVSKRRQSILSLKALTLPAGIIFALVVYLLQVPNSDEFRYLMPLIIPVLLLIPSVLPEMPRVQMKEIVVISITAIACGVNMNHMSQQLEVLANSVKGTWYVQEARMNTGKWLEKNTPSGTKILAGDIGALSYYNPSNLYIDSAGLVNRDLLEVVIDSGDYAAEILRRKPDYIVDTTGKDGIPASEFILDNLSKYYKADKTTVYASCKSSEMYSRELVFQDPPLNSTDINISVSKLEWKNCNVK